MGKVGINRNGEYIEVDEKDLTNDEVCELLSYIEISTENAWFPETTLREGRAAIREAIRRLKNSPEKK